MKSLIDGFLWGLGASIAVAIVMATVTFGGEFFYGNYYDDQHLQEMEKSNYTIVNDVKRYIPANAQMGHSGLYKVSGQLKLHTLEKLSFLEVRIETYNKDGIFLETCSGHIDLIEDKVEYNFSVTCYDSYQEDDVSDYRYSIYH